MHAYPILTCPKRILFSLFGLCFVMTPKDDHLVLLGQLGNRAFAHKVLMHVDAVPEQQQF